MLLTCPICKSGLQVPDGTTAHVRCPACRSIFAAEDGLSAAPVVDAPAPPPPLPAPPQPLPPRPAPPPLNLDDDPKPRRKPKPRDDDFDFDDDEDDEDDKEKKPKRRTVRGKRVLMPEQKKRLKAAFDRAKIGARLIQISLFFYIPGVLFVPLHQIIQQITKDDVPVVLVIAGVLGIVNWVLGAIGISLCLSGPPSPGHFRFGIAAIVVSVVHAVLLLAVVVKTKGNADYRGLDRATMMWAQIATQYESLSFYLSYLLYPDEIPLRRSDTILGFLTGVAEMTRLILYLMTLGALAQAAGDKELSERCTRMAGRVAIIPGILALGMFIYKMVVVETGMGQTGMLLYALNYMYRSITLVVAGILGMTTRTVGDVYDACDSPFQSEIDLGGTDETIAFYGD
jgi:hypothetical protein